MTEDYSDAAKQIIKVRFPSARRLDNGAWVQRWRIETEANGPVSPTDLAAAEEKMSHEDFEVRIDQASAGVFHLLITSSEDSSQGRFLYAIYRSLVVFDRELARIVAIEGQERSCWIPFRKWGALKDCE